MEAGLDAAVDKMEKREQFEKLLRGQNPDPS
jgi:hypothetical protein